MRCLSINASFNLLNFTLRILSWIILIHQTKGDHSCEELTKKVCINQENDPDDLRCFYESDIKLTLKSAQDICQCNGLSLVSPTDEKSMDFLKENFHDDFWINLQRKNLQEFTFLKSGVISDEKIHDAAQENYACVSVYAGDSASRALYAAPCSIKKKSICRSPDDKVKEGLIPFFVQKEEELSWYEARHKCLLLGADLVYQKEGEEKITELLKSYRELSHQEEYWIGLHKEEWTWGDGAYLTYSYWDQPTGQPSTASETCVVSSRAQDARWNDVSCSVTSRLVCVTDVGDMIGTDVPGITSPTSTSSNLFRKLSDPVKYSLIAIIAVCGVLIIILLTVLICLCCRRRRRRQAQIEQEFRPRTFSTVSKIGVALPTPPGPPAQHYRQESMYDTISLDEVHNQGPHSMGTFQRGLSERSARYDSNFPPEYHYAGGANGVPRKNYTSVHKRRDDAGMSLTYDTVIADNECYGGL